MLDDVALVSGGGPAGLNGNNVTGAERCVGIVDEIVSWVGEVLRVKLSVYGSVEP